MSDVDDPDNVERSVRTSRPSLAQVRAVISFMEKHPDLGHRRLRAGVGHAKFKKLWVQLSKIANSIDGATKTTKGWIKFWSDKRRSIIIKQKQFEQGKIQSRLTPLETRIIELCGDTHKKKQTVKQEPRNDDDDAELFDETLSKDEGYSQVETLCPTESEERQLNVIDKLIEVMGHQSEALAEMAHTSINNSKALEVVAGAAHSQALAVDRLAGTFETISSSVHDIRNAILGIDNTMKRCYPPTATQQRQNSNIYNI